MSEYSPESRTSRWDELYYAKLGHMSLATHGFAAAAANITAAKQWTDKRLAFEEQSSELIGTLRALGKTPRASSPALLRDITAYVLANPEQASLQNLLRIRSPMPKKHQQSLVIHDALDQLELMQILAEEKDSKLSRREFNPTQLCLMVVIDNKEEVNATLHLETRMQHYNREATIDGLRRLIQDPEVLDTQPLFS